MDTTPALDLTDLKRVQEVLGTLLYYACAVNSTMLPAIGSLATQNAKPTIASHNEGQYPGTAFSSSTT